MSRDVQQGTVLVEITGNEAGTWTWDAWDTWGVLAVAMFERTELRQVAKDLALLLNCELEPVKLRSGRITGYYPIGRSENLRVEVKR